MSTIEELKTLASRKPRNIWEWLDLYDEEDREIIVSVILNVETGQAYEALRNLEPHGYPFHKTSIAHHRRALRLGGHQ